MPTIRPSTDLRNNYNEISTLCHQNKETIFITKNGHGDLAVMSIETYESLTNKMELYRLIDEGLSDLESGNVRDYNAAMKEIREGLRGGRI